MFHTRKPWEYGIYTVGKKNKNNTEKLIPRKKGPKSV
jgi:hypothetical protein